MALVPALATQNPVNRAPNTPPELIVATQDVLVQGLSLLFKLSDRTYSQSTEAPYQASIGGQYRQILEHFQCVIRSLRSGEINYEAREHNSRLETDVTYATIAICDVLRAVKNFDHTVLNRASKVLNTLPHGESRRSFVETTVGRELTYCNGRAIHHYAKVRSICGQLRIEVPAEFELKGYTGFVTPRL
jgi:hypothetical protein